MSINFQYHRTYSYVLPVGHEKIPVACFKNKDLLELDGFIDLPSGCTVEYLTTSYVGIYQNDCPVFLFNDKRIVLPSCALGFLFRINTKVKKRR